MTRVLEKGLLRAALLLIAGLLVVLTGCAQRVGAVEKTVPGGNAALGREAILRHGCGSCHTIPGVPGADTFVGPPLNQFQLRHYIAGLLPNTAENLTLWIQFPQSVEPGTAMPDLGVTESEARDIAAYLYSQS